MAMAPMCIHAFVIVAWAWSTACASQDGPPMLAHFRGINAVSFATSSMAESYKFYTKLGLACTYGGPSAEFTTFGSAGGPSGGDNSFHVNVFASSDFKRPTRGVWNKWGRAIFYVDNVDVVYNVVVGNGLIPEAAPADASWGERYFQILDPMGHELTVAKPLLVGSVPGQATFREHSELHV
uniref:VOC domain-containing protein n=1 Tax=Zooxanthella nutricula TaxID=1333877 RepID=A0A7S2KRL5_9DINO